MSNFFVIEKNLYSVTIRPLKEEAERIRKENQLLLKKEKEAMMKKESLGQKISDELVTPDDSIDKPENNQAQNITSPIKATVTPTTASGR